MVVYYKVIAFELDLGNQFGSVKGTQMLDRVGDRPRLWASPKKISPKRISQRKIRRTKNPNRTTPETPHILSFDYINFET